MIKSNIKTIIYFIIVFLVIISISTFFFVWKTKIFTIESANLKYSLKSNGLNKSREVIIKAGESKVFNFEITAQNDISSLYKIYYEGTTNESVKVNYHNSGQYSGIGTITPNGVIKVLVVVENGGVSPVTLKFGVEGSNLEDELAFNNNNTLHEIKPVIAYNYVGPGISPNTFPKKTEGYEVTKVDCISATGKWDTNNWSLSLSNITGGAVCTVTFDSVLKPVLVEGMIPVIYDVTSKTWKKADVSKEWYDYTKQEWANVVTVTSTNRITLMNSPVGTTIPMTDINTMWVWIPRYEYQYNNLGTSYAGGTQAQPGEIKVNFLSKDENTPSESSTYKIHPAFDFGGKQISGFWYGKFETSTKEVCTIVENSTNTNCDINTFTPQIKPSVISWRGARVSTFFTASRRMQTTSYTTYGFSNSTSYDTHMSKNTEWGAVAYLSQSRYGKYGNATYTGVNKEVAVNNCDKFITGVGGDTVSAASSSTTCTTNTYETTKGQSASTTGNITGVYDMSSGSWEYTMGILADPAGKPRSGNAAMGNSGFNGMLDDGTNYSGGVSFPDKKYYELYLPGNMNTACSGGICFGQSITETNGWYNDDFYFINPSLPWSVRGGSNYYSVTAGIFRIGTTGGYANIFYGVRFVLSL